MTNRTSANRTGKSKFHHPFFTIFIFLFIAVCVFCNRSQSKYEYKKLDYSKPVFTSELAIVCPKSLLLDVRADHGPAAVWDAFMSFTSRGEKARALGCEEWIGGIPVHAHRMTSPFEDF
ncbi:MAG: hypothetical protein JWQ42_2762, partial [Edaphobacter sp.]|nr:hypothetical protein [Edaphobacter sp.]